MIKQVPSPARIAAMVGFTLSCFALLIFLWLSFGGPIPLRPEGYRVEVAFPEAATLAQEADVRIPGVNVGKVKTKRLDEGGHRSRCLRSHSGDLIRRGVPGLRRRRLEVGEPGA